MAKEEGGLVIESEQRVFKTENGCYTVYIQGSLTHRKSNCVLLTLHDIGNSHLSLLQFCSLPCMQPLISRSLTAHICLPGQDPASETLEQPFPSMDQISGDLIGILKKLSLTQIILVAVGAGANIALRLAMQAAHLVLGVVAIQPTSSAANIREQVKERTVVSNLKLSDHNTATDQFLIQHKFGHFEADVRQDVETYKDALHRDLNPRNLMLYVEAYMKRGDITENIKNHLKCDTLLIVGSQSEGVKDTEELYKTIQKGSQGKSKTSLMKIEKVGDVLTQKADKVAEAILFFCQGLGMVPTALGPRTRNRTKTDLSRSISMSSADIPNIRRLSLSEN